MLSLGKSPRNRSRRAGSGSCRIVRRAPMPESAGMALHVDTDQLSAPPPVEAEPSDGRLRRSRSHRMLAGVAGGLAERYDVDVALVRVAFVAPGIIGVDVQ